MIGEVEGFTFIAFHDNPDLGANTLINQLWQRVSQRFPEGRWNHEPRGSSCDAIVKLIPARAYIANIQLKCSNISFT